MFNNIKRNLTIFNKDLVETSWLKSLIDDVPKQKHLQTLKKCFLGEHPNVVPKSALKKISLRLQHIQKPITALKTIYLVHQLEQFLISYLSDKIIDQQSKDPADILIATLAHDYCTYLKSKTSRDIFEQINNIFRMYRVLEVLHKKTNIPIIKEIMAQLLIDIIQLHSQLDFLREYEKSIRALKQIKRFIELKHYLQLPKEIQNTLNQLTFEEIEKQKTYEIKICKTIPVSMDKEKIQFEPKENKLTMSIQIEDAPYFDATCTIQDRKMSLQTAPNSNRSKFVTQNSTARAPAIKNNFFVPKQGPLSFLIPG